MARESGEASAQYPMNYPGIRRATVAQRPSKLPGNISRDTGKWSRNGWRNS
jgi:hypothetical protein